MPTPVPNPPVNPPANPPPNPPVNPANPPANPLATASALLAPEGFPPWAVKAFIATASLENAVVMTRTPGPAALGLIDARYDLKGYYIKSKSCTWGPMAGFVCMLPWFNKEGANKALYNLEYCVHYLKDRPTLPDTRGDPFLPIRILPGRLAQLAALSKANLVTDMTAWQANPRPAALLGYAHDDAKTVIMDFLLRPIGTGPWQLRCGNVWIKVGAGDQASYLRFDPQSLWFSNGALIAKQGQNKEPVVPDAVATTLTTHLQRFRADTDKLSPAEIAAMAIQRAKIAGFDGAGAVTDKFYPIVGFVNPFPPYAVPAPQGGAATYDDYRNCLSGDYDLFAVWPALNKYNATSSPLSSLVRWSEDTPGPFVPTKPRKADDPPPNLSLQTGKLFTNVPGKPYARRLTINLNVIVEFVPDFADSSPLESSAYGNANAVVLKVADRLNAQVLSTFDNPPGSFESPAVNVAFHSDEGGRPYTKDIGFPVALFLPDHLVNTGGGPKQTQARPVAQLIATNAAFLAAMMDLKANCLVPIQAAWLASLMLAAQAPDNEKLAAPLRSLILGPLPPNKYTDLQEAAYQELYDAFLKIMGPLTEKGVFSKSLGTAEVVRNQVIPLFDALNVDGKVDLDAVEAMLAGMGTE